MKTKYAFSFLMLSAVFSTEALAGDPVVGAIIGGGVGAAVGNSIGGRDGAVVGGMLGAMTGVIVATDKDGRRDTDYRVRHEDRYDRDYGHDWVDDCDDRDHGYSRVIYRHAPPVVYQPAHVVVVRQPAPRVVYVRDWHPGHDYGHGHGYGHGYGHHKWHGKKHHHDHDD